MPFPALALSNTQTATTTPHNAPAHTHTAIMATVSQPTNDTALGKRTANDDAQDEVLEARIRWAKAMRLAFSPPAMLTSDGSIRQEHFKPKQVYYAEPKTFGSEERAALLKGLDSHGVGAWNPIREQLLPSWDNNTLRLKTCRLLGIQNLSTFQGFLITEKEVEAIQAAHHKLGEQTGCWKGGMLVEDDNGTLAAAMASVDVPMPKRRAKGK